MAIESATVAGRGRAETLRQALFTGSTLPWAALASGQPPFERDIHPIYATALHLLGLDHRKSTYRFQGRDLRLTEVSGRVVAKLLA